MLRTAICDLFGIKYPVIQGAMAHLSTAELVSAVSNAGGLGIIAAAGYEPDWVRDQIRLTRQQTDKPFGVNIYIPSPYTGQVVRVVIEEKVPVVATGAGNPGVYMSRFKEAGIKVMPVVSSVALAERLERMGADAIVAEGMEAGGHIGETTTMALVPQVVDAVTIPVVAAGGIADGRGLVVALALGAKGIQMGTRFICSEECNAHLRFKEKILKAGDRDTVVTGQTTGHPVRCLANRLTSELLKMERAGASKEELEQFGKGRFYQGVIEGNVEEGSLMAGQIAGMIKDIKPVKAIIGDIMAQAEEIISGLESFRVEDRCLNQRR
ncbi:MAG: enoyl-[acyl-carrier-protein] reductase FabK [Dehalococcoidia bacterium]|nr:enoyl-[acyl-carrier-protein] reductase FabK [Dehalococcoidia bacterium]